jgi:hypothetical protein
MKIVDAVWLGINLDGEAHIQLPDLTDILCVLSSGLVASARRLP